MGSTSALIGYFHEFHMDPTTRDVSSSFYSLFHKRTHLKTLMHESIVEKVGKVHYHLLKCVPIILFYLLGYTSLTTFKFFEVLDYFDY